MKKLRFNFHGAEYEVDWMLTIALVVLALFFNQLNINDKNSALVSDMNRQRTAAEMRAHNAEQKLANNTQNAPGVVIISPDGKTVQAIEPKTNYSSIQREVSF
ncbi:TPA: hypothetical protein ROF77_002142 [Enterobacter asburiae]|nr:hypothetical protein [Enterobacter asburiae]